MSPEQIIGCPVDARSDIWSLGVVAFECLTGNRAFEGETLGAFALAIHTLSPPSVTGVRPELPSEVDVWFRRACARSREERFASATDAAEALASALGIEVSPPRLGPKIQVRPVGDRTLTDDFALTRAQPRLSPGPRPLRVASIAGAVLTVAAILWAARADQSVPRRGGQPSALSQPATVAQSPKTAEWALASSSAQPFVPTPATERAGAPVAVTPEPTQPAKKEARAPASPRAHAAPPPPTPAISTSSHVGRLDALPDERN
jgi:serine/threonine-protein kinase